MMTRDEATRILEAREGTPPEHVEACRTDDLVVAAQAPEGQPCADCGFLVVWVEDETDWRHVNGTPDRGCFLA